MSDSQGWHANCHAEGVMKSSFEAGTREENEGPRRARVAVAVALLLAVVILPAPRPAAREKMTFSVMSGDYISPLISSPRGIQILNARLRGSACFAGYDQIEAFANVGSGPDLTGVTRYSGDIFSLVAAQFTLRSAPGAMDRPVYISEAYWKRAFSQSPDALGREIQVSNESFQIAGVVRWDPAMFTDTEIWVPLSSRGPYAEMTSLRVLGELRGRASWQSGEKALAALLQSEAVKPYLLEVDAVRFLPLERRMMLYAARVLDLVRTQS